MRNKLREIKNREEGFTLVELLAVIVILGIIVAIAIPAIGNVIERARGNATSAEQALVVDAARLYAVENEVTNGQFLTVEQLETAGYLDTRESDIPSGAGVRITTVGSSEDDRENYNFEYLAAAPTG